MSLTKPNVKQLNESLKKLKLSYSEILESKIKNLEDIEKKYKELWALIFKKKIEILKEYWRYEFKSRIINEIKEVYEKTKGKFARPSTIGLFNKWDIRQKIIKSIKKLKNSHFSDKVTIMSEELPDRGTIDLIKKYETINFNDKPTKDFNGISKNQLSKFNKIFGVKMFENPENKIKNVELEYWKENWKKIHKIETKFIDKDCKTGFSKGERTYLALMSELNKERSIFLLDEPGVYLGSEMISRNLLKKIVELKAKNKTIIISTHQASIALNSIPLNMIYRVKEESDNYSTYKGDMFTMIFKRTNNNEGKEKDFIETILANFEGSKNHFNFRKETYDIKN